MRQVLEPDAPRRLYWNLTGRHIGMAFTKPGFRSFACKGLVHVLDVWDSGPRGTNGTYQPTRAKSGWRSF